MPSSSGQCLGPSSSGHKEHLVLGLGDPWCLPGQHIMSRQKYPSMDFSQNWPKLGRYSALGVMADSRGLRAPIQPAHLLCSPKVEVSTQRLELTGTCRLLTQRRKLDLFRGKDILHPVQTIHLGNHCIKTCGIRELTLACSTLAVYCTPGVFIKTAVDLLVQVTFSDVSCWYCLSPVSLKLNFVLY